MLEPPSSSSGASDAAVVELSASALDSEVSLVDLALSERPSSASRDARVARARPRATRPWFAVVAASVVLALGIAPGVASAVGERASGVTAELRRPARDAREVGSQFTPLAARTGARSPSVPAGACEAVGASRVLSTRAHLPPGLDVSATEGGFGVAFASGPEEAVGVGLRFALDGLPLRVAERVKARGRPGSRVRHMAVVDTGDEEGELDLRVDTDDSRVVQPVPSGTGVAPVRIGLSGGWIRIGEAGAAATRALWPVPRLASAGTSRLPSTSAPAAAELRAAAREGGGVAVALRTAPGLWVGLVDSALRAEGSLTALSRPGAALGTPAVARVAAGGAVAWAERPAGGREWIVMLATFADDGERSAPRVRPLGAGMSPSLVALPGGDLLVAYAVGGAGAHRVVARRLSRELEPRGDAIVVSPETVNAGQPAAAVAADGRALVAFFGAERGRPPSVLAAPLACGVAQ